MAQNSSQLKRKPRENQYIFDLGVRGRKTGLTLEDTGIRDEHGLEPMDHLFSSPEKSTRKGKGKGKNADATISSEEEMDIVESTLPEADARHRSSIRMPIPHSRSPKKTFLQSPARRNPSLGPLSSPSRGSIMVPRGPPESISVRRKLDFSNENFESGASDARAIGRSPQKRADSRTAALGKGKGSRAQPVQAASEDEEQEEVQDQYYDEEIDAYPIMDDGDVDLDNPIPESDPEPEPEPVQKPKGKGKGKGKGKAKEPAPAKLTAKSKGRPKRKSDAAEENDDSEPPTKKTRRSLEGAKPNGKPSKAAAPTTAKARPAATPGKGKAKKTNLATISENDSPAVQRGPPMPRSNRGLVILRRETPMDSNGFKQTRSGRNSVRPVAYWKNERIEYSEDENTYYNGGNFLLPKIKGVIRADDVEEERRTRGPRKTSKGTKRNKRAAVESEDEEEDAADIEPWETEPGRLVGEIREWDPDDPTGMNTEEVEEEIAISSSAIQTKDIAGASFRFAKTLTMPFFGSGVVDLPPGSEKKPKNSRKMQMVFFVFYGRVEVTVNESTFKIGKGGMWQVPRGNFYSIANDSDKPARIFFSQGCELLEEMTEAN